MKRVTLKIDSGYASSNRVLAGRSVEDLEYCGWHFRPIYSVLYFGKNRTFYLQLRIKRTNLPEPTIELELSGTYKRLRCNYLLLSPNASRGITRPHDQFLLSFEKQRNGSQKFKIAGPAFTFSGSAIEDTEKWRVAKTELPKRICVLDIETDSGKISDLSTLTVGLAGTQCYVLEDGSYRTGEYRVWKKFELLDLRAFLINFRGLILGHNLFGFDYPVLENYFSIPKSVYLKTCDTLAFLLSINWSLQGLGLNNLAGLNLKRTKTGLAKQVPILFKEGRIEQIIKYNKNDCALTFLLWRHLLEKGFLELQLPYWQRRDGSETKLRLLNDIDLKKLLSGPNFKTRKEAVQFSSDFRLSSKSFRFQKLCRGRIRTFETNTHDSVDKNKASQFAHLVGCVVCNKMFKFHSDHYIDWLLIRDIPCPRCDQVELQSFAERTGAHYSKASAPLHEDSEQILVGLHCCRISREDYKEMRDMQKR